MDNRKPLLTIGIIFRNNLRTIERCLKALTPLRESVPCELIMADTGSTDFSREVARQYADILFDFPWIDDFAAARNAVMDKASGKWFFTVDTDEYLDEDITGLKTFLEQSPKKVEAGVVIQRNYRSYDMDDDYNDFLALRLLRLSTGVRYQGKIHEAWHKEDGGNLSASVCPGAILHHDGYVELQKPGAEKAARNLALLREKVENEPENLLAWLQLMESGSGEPDYWEIANKAMALVEEKKPHWELAGPPIVRQVALQAIARNREDAEERVKRAETLFPDSLFVRIDVQYMVFFRLWRKKDYAGCIPRGEDYLRAMDDFRAGKDLRCRMYSAFQMTSPSREREVKIYLADAFAKEHLPNRALELLENIEIGKLDSQQLEAFMIALREIHKTSELDTAPLLTAAWESVSAPDSDETRKRAFLRTCGAAFASKNRESEKDAPDFCRPAYTLCRPLGDCCELGRAARILDTEDPELLTQMLTAVENWVEFPAAALACALERGADFPSAKKPLTLEVMDTLAERLVKAEEKAVQWAVNMDISAAAQDPQDLCWARALVFAVVQAFPWSGEEVEAKTGLALARAFAQVEREFLPLCYAPGILTEERLFLLPPMHRFGWHCAPAFAALDAGDAAAYVRLLREGLDASEDMKPMVEFLVKHTPGLQAPLNELKALAEQIRKVLAGFAPDDPAVAAVKQSEAYQKVAFLIEGAEVPIVGGLKQ